MLSTRSQRFNLIRFFLANLAVIFAGCATVNEVHIKPGRGGTIAVYEGPFGESADVQAERIMKSRCPDGHRILEMGEEVVGSETMMVQKKESENKPGDINDANSKHELAEGNSQTVAESQTKDITEWRIRYECEGNS